MPSANGVFGGVYVLIELLVAVRLDSVHPFPIQFFDTLPNLSVVRVVVSEVKSLSPVAEVA